MGELDPVRLTRRAAKFALAQAVKHRAGKGKQPRRRREPRVGGGGGVAIVPVLVTSVTPAAYDSMDGALTPGEASAYRYSFEDDSYTVLGAESETLENNLPDVVDIPTGVARIGLASGNQLIQLSCIEVDLPT